MSNLVKGSIPMDGTRWNSAMSFRDAAVHHLSMSETQGNGHHVDINVDINVEYDGCDDCDDSDDCDDYVEYEAIRKINAVPLSHPNDEVLDSPVVNS